MRVISCSSFTDSSSFSSNATMRNRVGSDKARNDFRVEDILFDFRNLPDGIIAGPAKLCIANTLVIHAILSHAPDQPPFTGIVERFIGEQVPRLVLQKILLNQG